MGSCPVFSSITRAPPPDCQCPSQNRLSAIRGRIASIVASAGCMQLTNVRGTAATRFGSKSSTAW
jgi:hypothetical protein